MATSWTTATVAACLTPIPTTGKTKLQTRDYRPAGRYPIVDQGQERIAGWTDDERAVIRDPLPLIVFGDHTRILKFVDQPFARGADGTQLLRPKAGINPLFFFYACKAIDLPARGYNRHFTVLRELSLSYPGEEEQQAIGAVLRRVETVMEHQFALFANAYAIKQSSMRDLYASGLRGESQKETEIGLLPASWDLQDCYDLCTDITVGVVVRPASYYVPTGVAAFRSLNVREDHLDARTLVYFSPKASNGVLAKSRLSAGDVLIVRTGYPGTSCVVPSEYEGANCIDLIIAKPITDQVLPGFLSRFFNSPAGRRQALGLKQGLAQKHLNVGAVKRIRIPVPSLAEQREIVTILDSIDRKIALHQRKRAVLDDLFKAMLHKLMTGEIAVDQLDLSALSEASAQEGTPA